MAERRTGGAAAVPWRARIALALFGVLLSLATAETGLRAAHFHFDLIPTLEFGFPDPVALRDAFTSDNDLIWVTKDYRTALREARRSHPALVFMGDSCTEFGSYPSRTLAALQAGGSPLTPAVKLGVAGWSSAQGLEQLRRDIIPLHPRVVTIYYGWNDHWMAMGLTDPEIVRAHWLRTVAEHVRLAQLWLKVKVTLAARRRPLPNRVPLAAYEANLRAMATEARAAGITPIFITAPSNHVAGHEPEYLAKRHVRALSEVVPLHEAYLRATRESAAAAGARLCDAAAAFAALPAPHDALFQRDGIHLSAAGDDALAHVLAGCLADIR